MSSGFSGFEDFSPNEKLRGMPSVIRPITPVAVQTKGSMTGGAYPISPNEKITSMFGNRKAPKAGASTYHKGIDIAGAMNEPFKSVFSGTVQFAGKKQGYGNTVIVRHQDGTESLYAHANGISVKRGQKVNAGSVLGMVGSTGNSTGPHLHFQFMKGGKAIDPMSILKGLGKNLSQPTKQPITQMMGAPVPPPVDGDKLFGGFEGFDPAQPQIPQMRPMMGAPQLAPAPDVQPQRVINPSPVRPNSIDPVMELITRMAIKHGVNPKLALAVAQQESGRRQIVNGKTIKNPSGATGMFQLMPGTAQELGVDPNTLEGNVEGGVKYLAKMKKLFGPDIAKQLAGYNAGPGNVMNNNYRKYPETMNYINKIMGNMK